MSLEMKNGNPISTLATRCCDNFIKLLEHVVFIHPF